MALENYVKNKSVAIVGNAQSYVGCALSYLIDSADVVIRINRIADVSEELGSKTSIFLYNNTNQLLSEFVEFYQVQVHTLNIEGYDKSKRPSSGLRCVYNLVNFCEPASITLYGFDFMSSVSMTTPNRKRNPHSFDIEEQVIKEYEAKGKIRIHEVNRSS